MSTEPNMSTITEPDVCMVPATVCAKVTGIGNLTYGTKVTDFALAKGLLSLRPLRAPRLDDVYAARLALDEPGESIPYDDLRKELGLD